MKTILPYTNPSLAWYHIYRHRKTTRNWLLWVERMQTATALGFVPWSSPY
jgi:hypothetical protein